jgi:hypothetical protein
MIPETLFMDQSLKLLVMMSDSAGDCDHSWRQREIGHKTPDLLQNSQSDSEETRINGKQAPKGETVENASPMNDAIEGQWLFRDCPLFRGVGQNKIARSMVLFGGSV